MMIKRGVNDVKERLNRSYFSSERECFKVKNSKNAPFAVLKKVLLTLLYLHIILVAFLKGSCVSKKGDFWIGFEELEEEESQLENFVRKYLLFSYHKGNGQREVFV